MKLREYIFLIALVLMIVGIVGIFCTFKTNPRLCARFIILWFVSMMTVLHSGFQMDYGGKRRNKESKREDMIVHITITDAKNPQDES